MRRRGRGVSVAVALGVAATLPTGGPAAAASFVNATTIAVPPPQGSSESAGEPYPSTIAVSGLSGSVTDVNVTLCGLSATFPSDLDLVVKAPNGTTALVMSDVGGTGEEPQLDPHGDVPVSNLTVTIDDEAPGPLPADGPLTSGTFRPWDDDVGEFDTPTGADADTFLTPPLPIPQPNPADRLGVFRPSTGTWFFRSDSNNVELSAFDGVEPNGTWSLFVGDDVAASVEDGELQAPVLACGWSIDISAGGSGVPPGNGTIIQWGTAGDIPVPGDYDGNGSLEVAVFRPSNGYWFIQGGGALAFGADGDIPVPGDYDGNGSTDIAVYRPSNSVWFVRGGPTIPFGTAGDLPVPGDYDNDDDVDIAVFRPSNGVWFINGPLNDAFTPTVVAWGTTGDIPVSGDFDRNGRDNVAVFRPSTGIWFVQGTANFAYGASGDVPVPYDINNDAYTDAVVFRPSTGVWFSLVGPAVAFGTSGDIPVPAPPAVKELFFP
jgi:hypothetical protein